MPPAAPLSVAVLVELVRGPASGGHVKCWERLAGAVAGMPGVDLTVYVLGAPPGTDPIADNVRFVALRPVLTSSSVQGLVGGVDGSDLTPFHPGLARRLPGHQVWHATHSFAFTATALRLQDRYRPALVGSVHTDVPALAALYTRQVLGRLPAGLGDQLGRFRPEAVVARLARRRRDRLLRACSHVLASSPDDAAEFAAAAPDTAVSRLRRGLDTRLFSRGDGDRQWLSDAYGLSPTSPLVLFAGRVDVSKGAPLLAEAVHRLHRAGVPVHLVLAGDGAAVAPVRRLLGPAVTHLGHLPQAELARVYAGCDVFAFPSRSETAGNVVLEAMAAGLPVVLPAGERTAQWLTAPGEDGVLVSADDPDAWAAALRPLLTDGARRARIGEAARRTVERTVPRWSDVVREDLLPVWRAAASAGSAAPRLSA
ncbi:glycosyltransferase [Modestobacter sp. VKM Ac-2983]|uniref:glycosyltransferase n=1 Tax=Modestobacter sp. VKM Ac-2983 TaxID=3004137 RepID=UPI0022AB7CEB|nr:glycosyltransferase [Modestobacter sp. VKM Ac-2983]